MATTQTNPFIYGRPVRGKEFIDREDELRTVFNRLRNGESTGVIGEPHAGKTSFLLHLSRPETAQAHLGQDKAERAMMVFCDLHAIPAEYTPADFWSDALERLAEKPGSRQVGRLLQTSQASQFSRRSLEKLFQQLCRENRTLVLLLDEFERLLKHANFQDPAFFALLRGLCTHCGGLALVPASRMSIAQMNELGRGLLDTGSPFFNNMIQVALKPFEAQDIGKLLAPGGFTSQEQAFIVGFAGRNPFLLQAMAAALIDDRQPERAGRLFYERAAFHFDDLWRGLDEACRTTATILSVMQLGGLILGRDLAYGEIERADRFGPELVRLEELGLAERMQKTARGWIVDWEHGLVWRGERWAIASQAFLWWVRDAVIARSRKIPAVDEWLESQAYRGPLTHKQWDDLLKAIQSAPQWAKTGVGSLARLLWEALRRKA